MSEKPPLFLDGPDSLPFPLTISHYHVFSKEVAVEGFKGKKLDSPESWDMLRSTDPLFTIPETRGEWVAVSELSVRKDGQDARLKERGKALAALLRKQEVTTLFSTGSGGAGLEYQVHKAYPELTIVCSEYAPKSVELLKRVFTEAEDVIPFDIREGDWGVVTSRADAQATVCLMYRLDAQFTDRQWHEIFARMAAMGVTQVLYIPTGFLTLRSLLVRFRSRLGWALTGKPMVFSGYLRTKTTFQSFWKRHYFAEEHVLAGMNGFLLRLIK